MKSNQNAVEALALERIYRLFELAEQEFLTQPKRSHHYVQLALKIGMRNRCRIPSELKTSYCKKCHSFLKDKINRDIIDRGGFVEIHCHECNNRFKRKKAEQ